MEKNNLLFYNYTYFGKKFDEEFKYDEELQIGWKGNEINKGSCKKSIFVVLEI